MSCTLSGRKACSCAATQTRPQFSTCFNKLVVEQENLRAYV